MLRMPVTLSCFLVARSLLYMQLRLFTTEAVLQTALYVQRIHDNHVDHQGWCHYGSVNSSVL